MLKYLHLAFVALVITSFLLRVAIGATHAPRVRGKISRILPHVIDTGLLFSGIALFVYGNWLNRDFNWVMAKLAILPVYIGLGMLALRKQGLQRWTAAAAALFCVYLIVNIAVSKKIMPF